MAGPIRRHVQVLRGLDRTPEPGRAVLVGVGVLVGLLLALTAALLGGVVP